MATTQAPPRDIDIPAYNANNVDFTIVPEGIYLVEFTTWEDGIEMPKYKNPAEMEAKVRLIYTIVEGEYQGETIDELCTLTGGTEKFPSKLRERCATLRGGPYGLEDRLALSPLVGRRAQAVVKIDLDETTRQPKRNKIESLVAMPAPRAAGAPPPARPAPAAAPKRKF